MYFRQLDSQLQTAAPKLLLLESADHYVIKHCLQQLRQKLFGHTDVAKLRSLCHEEIYDVSELGGQKVVEQLLLSLQTLSMFSSFKLILVRDIDQLEAAAETRLLNELPALLKDCEHTICLQATKVRANGKLKKLVETHGLHLHANLSRRADFTAEIRLMAQAHGMELSHGIMQFLADNVALDLTALANEIEKIALYQSGRAPATLAEVSLLLCSSNIESVFRLTDAVAEKNPRQAVQLLRTMLAQGEAPQPLMGMLARQLRHLYRVKQAESSHLSRQDILQALETTSSFVLDKATQAARRFQLPQLRQALQQLFNVDLELKRTSLNPAILLERLVWQLAHPTPRKGS